MRAVRTLMVFKLGFWAGIAAGGAVLRRALPSRGDAESDEVRLVAALNGVQLKSRAQAFSGGSMLSWLGGIAVDLRDARLADGAHLDVTSLVGGIAIRVPTGWRVESNVHALLGGVAVDVPEPDDPDAPTLTVDGVAIFGGVAIGAKKPETQPDAA